MQYSEMSKEELLTLQAELNQQYAEAKAKGLNLDMSRGKPSATQLNVSLDLLDAINASSDLKAENGTDCRNYGVLLNPTIPNLTNCINASHCVSFIFNRNNLHKIKSIIFSIISHKFIAFSLSFSCLFQSFFSLTISLNILSIISLNSSSTESSFNDIAAS